MAKFDCRINVEVCSSVKAVKYIYKYVHKGHDRIHFCINADRAAASSAPSVSASSTTSATPSVSDPVDEIKDYQTGRWVCAVEAMWRIYLLPLSEMHPSVIHL